jgi:hypothetical protein
MQLRKIVKGEFVKNKNEVDEEKIKQLKGNGIRALTNYLVLESSIKDPKMNRRVSEYKATEAASLEQRDPNHKK